MVIMINIILFILEVLYYSLFMKYAKKEGKLWRYFLLFTICSILVAMINSKNLIAYLVFIVVTYIGLRYLVRIKTSLYDMLAIVIMLLLKVVIELPLFLILYNWIHFNHFIVVLLVELVKLLIILLCKFKMNRWYLRIKVIWDNNDFNIRYGFTIVLYLYVILTVTLLIKLIWR